MTPSTAVIWSATDRPARMLVEYSTDGRFNGARLLVGPAALPDTGANAHGLLVHTWTFRNEQRRLPSDYRGNPVNEYLQFYELGIDGVFPDFADIAVASRVLFQILSDQDFAECLTGDARVGRGRDCR